MHFESMIHFLAMLKDLFPEPTKTKWKGIKLSIVQLTFMKMKKKREGLNINSDTNSYTKRKLHFFLLVHKLQWICKGFAIHAMTFAIALPFALNFLSH